MFGDQGRVIVSITLRAVMGRKRALLFAIPPAILLLVTVLIKLAHPHDAAWPSEVLGVFGVYLPSGPASSRPPGTPVTSGSRPWRNGPGLSARTSRSPARRVPALR